MHQRLLQRFPNDLRLLQALIGYHKRLGQHEQAYEYRQRLKKSADNDGMSTSNNPYKRY